MQSHRTLNVLLAAGGWITPGTGEQHRRAQLNDHLSFLARRPTPATGHFLFSHCGWFLDHAMNPAVRALTTRNPEPHRHLGPCAPATLRRFRRYIDQGRLEYCGYPYAACVAEATTGEGLLRTHRFSLDIAESVFGRRPRFAGNHDGDSYMSWGAVQMPQIARLLGIRFMILTRDGLVTAPDGTTVTGIGPSATTAEILQGRVDLRRPYYWGFELHDYLELADELRQRRNDPKFELMRFEFKAITADTYLRRMPPGERCDSRDIGTKNWYGGVLDSLAMEQNAKSVELRLPAIEALMALSGQAPAASPGRRLPDLWKQCFILMDNHILWQCHNYKAHYLPASGRVLADALSVEAGLLQAGRAAGKNRWLFNPTPWARDLVVTEGRRRYVAHQVPGWGAAVARPQFPPRRPGSRLLTFANEQVRFDLNPHGEIVGMEAGGERQTFAGLGRLMRILERPVSERRRLAAGQPFDGIEGALCASAEVAVPHPRTWQLSFAMDRVVGEAYLLQAERLDEAGGVIGTESIPLHSLHWAGPGLPRHESVIAPRLINAWGARRIRLKLWMIAEGRVELGPARVWLIGDAESSGLIPAWTVDVLYRNRYERAAAPRVSTVLDTSDVKTLRFRGRLPDLRYAMDVTLRRGSRALEYALSIDFPRPTALGLRTPPFTEADGSLLGAQCERPYVPGLAVLCPLPAAARYYVDKPYYLQPAFHTSARTWHTDRQDWWLGLSTFIGMNLAAADYGAGQVGLMTRGLKHFFRWHRGTGEILGLSLGATLIHAMTQGHSAPRDSALYGVIKRTTHDPYERTDFLRARGRYTFHYAIGPGTPGPDGRLELWRAAQEFALPVQPVPTDRPAGLAHPGLRCSPAHAVVTAIEPCEDGSLRLRVVNMSARRTRATLSLPAPERPARRRAYSVPLKPWEVRELVLA